MRLAFAILATTSFGLTACGPQANLADGGPSGGPSGPVVCNAFVYQDLVGQPIGVVDTLNTGLNVRVLGPDSFVTKDFDPNRLTFTTTPKFEVGRVFCG
jgi:hypothetical protein